jgi:TonB family protein
MPVWISYSLFIESALKSTVMLGAAWVVALWLRRRSAAIRHLAWSSAFAALLTLPFLSLALPALHLSVTDSLLAPSLVFRTNASASVQEPPPRAGHQGANASLQESAPWFPDWRVSLLLIWAVGTTVSLAQIGIGWAALRHLRHKARPLTIAGLNSLTGLLGMEDGVDLLETPRGSMPMTYGLLRPTIFVPVDMAEWGEERRRVVLLHELAHVRRGDGATHLLARTALALYWWNPLAWSAWREFLKERERATDDLVLNAGACASDYAGHLLEIARSMQSPAAFAWAAVAAARRSQLECRLLAILDSHRNRKAPRRVSVIAASLVGIAIMAPLAAIQAQSASAQTQVSVQESVGSPAALIKSGDLEREQRKFDQAKALYRKALAVLNTGPEAATAFIHVGTVDLATNNIGQAISDFGQAQTADPAKAGEAQMWTAIAHERQNNLEAAAACYQNALAAEAPDSAAAATIMELYAQLLLQQGRDEEANTMRIQAAGIRKALAAQTASSGHASSSDVNRIGGEVTAPVLTSKAEPEYTEEARIAKYQGTAVLSIEVGPDGLAHNIRVVRTLGLGLDQKAVEALSRWRFSPGAKAGQPVTVAATVEINFKLK